MKRCRVCRSNYPFSQTVCPADGTRLEEVQGSWALARVIEVTTSAAPPGETDEDERRGGRTLLDDLREFFEDERLHRLYLTFGAHGVELQLSRAAVSLGLFSFGVLAMGIGLLALSGDVASGDFWRLLADLLLGLGLAGMITPLKGLGRGGGMVLTGIALLAHTLGFVELSLWPLLTVAAGGCSLSYRRRLRVSDVGLKFMY